MDLPGKETDTNRLKNQLNDGAEIDQDKMNAARERLTRRAEILKKTGFNYQNYLAAIANETNGISIYGVQ